ncbi:VanW family protein [Lysinibacillus xylanilyticus]|uniref:VanW family protein n=1 Tax=Lysinibacillus xylanilyticus TaxID=582475 RepID=UPI002E1B4474|nr:VanW family protein [Lysinibacillus xylanilyticus]
MKSLVKIGSVLIVLILLLVIWIPNYIIDNALAKGGGSTIGGISVKGLEDENIEEALQEAINTWRERPISVKGAGVDVTVDPSLFTFDVAGSVAEYHNLTDKSWYAFWQSKKTVHLSLHVSADNRVKAKLEGTGVWEVEPTLSEIISNASYLKNREFEAKVADTSTIEAERLALSIEEIPKNTTDVLELANSLNDSIITPNEPFSLLTALGEQSGNIDSESLNFVASNIYHTALQTEYEIVERHAQNTAPVYLQQGLDARVNRGLDMDLQFVNHSDQPNKLKLTVEGDSLKVELLAQKREKEISVHVSKDKIIQPRVTTRYSKDLSIGREEVLQEGQEGVRVEVYRSILENGNTTEELVSRDYYPPVNKIIVRSSRQPVVSESIRNSDSSDPDLQMDLDGDGLPDTQSENEKSGNNAVETNTSKDPNDPEIVYGYYDKGGNFIQTSP